MAQPRYESTGSLPGGLDIQQRVCQRLDDLFLKYMEGFESLRSKKEELHKLMKDGFFSLSEASQSTLAGISGISSSSYAGSVRSTKISTTADQTDNEESKKDKSDVDNLEDAIDALMLEDETRKRGRDMIAIRRIKVTNKTNSEKKEDTSSTSKPPQLVFELSALTESAAIELAEEQTKLHKKSQNSQEDDEEQPTDHLDDEESDSDSLRQRGNAPSDVSSSSSSASSSSSTSSHPSSSSSTNPKEIDLRTKPLLWFGALIPPPLKTAQQQFIQSVQLLPEILNLSSQLTQIQHEFEYLSYLQQIAYVDPDVEKKLEQVLQEQLKA